MDFRRVDAISGTIKVKGIGSEQSRRNAPQREQHDEDEHDESAEQPMQHDRVSIATLHAPDGDITTPLVLRVPTADTEPEEEHPHLDLTV